MKKIFCYLITISYDGSFFDGWAKQPNRNTVQDYIEKNLRKILKRKINILSSSRTDKGVHAINQNFTLRISINFKKKNLFNLLNKFLKKNILLKKVKKIKYNFHPIRDVKEKEYRYLINTGKKNIFKNRYQLEYNLPIETKKFNEILNVFKGKHDFFNFSFCKFKERNKINTIRNITNINCWKRKNILIIRIISKGFLRYQIRAIIGESINCYEEKQTLENLENKLLSFKKEDKYKNIISTSGLYLWHINYKY